MRVQDSEDRGQNVGQEKENKEKEGHQETVNTPLTSPTDDLPLADSVNNNVQVCTNFWHFCCPCYIDIKVFLALFWPKTTVKAHDDSVMIWNKPKRVYAKQQHDKNISKLVNISNSIQFSKVTPVLSELFDGWQSDDATFTDASCIVVTLAYNTGKLRHFPFSVYIKAL